MALSPTFLFGYYQGSNNQFLVLMYIAWSECVLRISLWCCGYLPGMLLLSMQRRVRIFAKPSLDLYELCSLVVCARERVQFE